MKKTIAIVLISISSALIAQDSTATKVQESASPKKCSHEIAFNATFLVKQLISNNPSATLTQLPYVAGYQLGFGGKYGIRVGLGFEQSVQKTSIQGEISPRTTTLLTGAYRLDVCRQIFNYKKISCGMFFGAISDHTKLETNTVTDQGFGGIVKTEITIKSVSYGGEIGLGVKYSFNKHIGLGLEIPLQCKYSVTKEQDKQTITSGSSTTITQTISSGSIVSTKIFLPTSLFICIMF